MPSVAHLLDRFRRIRLAPGPPAWVVAVPTRTVEPAEEIAPLLPALDEIADEADRVVEAGRAAAARVEAEARERARGIEASGRERAERLAAEILAAADAEHRAQCAAIDARARVEASAIMVRGRERAPAIAERIVARVMGTPAP